MDNLRCAIAADELDALVLAGIGPSEARVPRAAITRASPCAQGTTGTLQPVEMGALVSGEELLMIDLHRYIQRWLLHGLSNFNW